MRPLPLLVADGAGVRWASFVSCSMGVCEGEGDGGGEGSSWGSAVVVFEDILAAVSSPTVKGGLEESKPGTGQGHAGS